MEVYVEVVHATSSNPDEDFTLARFGLRPVPEFELGVAPDA